MQEHSLKYQYTVRKLLEEMDVLRQTFTLVRLVSPEDCRTCHIEGDSISFKEACFRTWKRSSCCDYCLSREVSRSRTPGAKIESLDGRPFIVFAKCVRLNGKDYSLEMIAEITGMPSLNHEERVLGEIWRLQEENARLLRDPLTQCYSRHYLNNNFHLYVQEAKNVGKELCIALLDMDNFKHINDKYGHAIGDEVLRSCCLFWLKYFDTQHHSFLTRYGGDEFVITAMADSYEAFCERLRKLDASMRKNVVMDDGRTIPFSFTIGCACMSETLQSVKADFDVWSAMFILADKRMYEGKSTGRNRIITAD